MSKSNLRRPRQRGPFQLVSLFVLALSVPIGASVAADANPADVATSSAQSAHKPHPSGHQDEHEAAVYVCPMHPDVVREAPGRCPICGMYLEKMTRSESR